VKVTRSVECTKTKLNTQKESDLTYQLDSFLLPIYQGFRMKRTYFRHPIDKLIYRTTISSKR
jgi:hypothetical protein